MADQKLTALTALATPANGDLLYIVDDPSGTPLSKSITRANLLQDVLIDIDTLGPNAADGEFMVGTGAGALAWESGATVRTSLGLAIGSDVQAWDAQLDDIAALAVTDGNFIVGNGANWVAESGATARTSLGLVAGGAGDIWVENAGDTMTGALKIDVSSATALFVEDDGVKDNVLVVDTVNGRLAINGSNNSGDALSIHSGDITIDNNEGYRSINSSALIANLLKMNASDELIFGDATGRSAAFRLYTDGVQAMTVTTAQLVGIEKTVPAAKLHIDQASSTAAIPVLLLDQADVSEEMIEFTSTVGVGNAIEAVGAKTLTTTHFIKVTITGVGTRYFPVGTIA